MWLKFIGFHFELQKLQMKIYQHQIFTNELNVYVQGTYLLFRAMTLC